MNEPAKVSYLLLNASVVVNFNNRSYTVQSSDKNYSRVIAVLKSGDHSEIPSLVDPSSRVAKNFVPAMRIDKGKLYIDGDQVSNYVADRIVEFAEKDLPYMPLIAFWRRLKKNPSKNSVNQLYKFLEVVKAPITERGTFLGYKAVRKDMRDKHSGTVQYALGKPTTLDRAKCSENPNDTCAPGLHVGSFEYASQFFGNKDDIILEVEVDPEHVVRVPNDHGWQKMAACQLTPLAVCNAKYDTPTVTTASRSEKKSVTLSENEAMIGRFKYVRKAVSKMQADTIVEQMAGVVRFRPSKAPQALGTIESGYRYVDPKYDGPCYLAKYANGDCHVWVPATAGDAAVEETVTETVRKGKIASGSVGQKTFTEYDIDEDRYYEIMHDRENPMISLRPSKRPKMFDQYSIDQLHRTANGDLYAIALTNGKFLELVATQVGA